MWCIPSFKFIFRVILDCWFFAPISPNQSEPPSKTPSSLRACPREHQAVVLHAISPNSMKLCQFKGSTQNSKRQTGFCFGFFPGRDRPPPGFSWFPLRKSLQRRWSVQLRYWAYVTAFSQNGLFFDYLFVGNRLLELTWVIRSMKHEEKKWWPYAGIQATKYRNGSDL